MLSFQPIHRMLVLVTVVAAVVATAAAQQSTLEVSLKQGTILGSREEATNGHVLYSFKAIPYAKPPVGTLRFKDPEPAPAWSGVRNGSLSISKCPQFSLLDPGTIEGEEDCLYLNVYTPRPYTSDLPVLVVIHGGGFVIGSAEDSGSPAPLVQKDIVVVAINYRLGTLGFLSTGDSVLPGNLGLKDQALALRWVQDNIGSLGGDPNRVTISGVSAGGVSVHFHVLSPGSAGLFKRAILQSGTALMAIHNASPRKGAITVSKMLNCTGEESQQLLACFMDATVKDLVYALSDASTAPYLAFPYVDGTFLPDHPAALLKDGRYNKVDVMSGTTKDDGNVVTAGLFSKMREQDLQMLNKNFTEVGPRLMLTTGEENPVYLARHLMLKELHYNTDFNITQEDEPALLKIFSDRYFHAPNAQTVEFHAKDPNIKTFMYQFDHHPEKSLMSIMMNVTQEKPTAGHGDDLLYIFEMPPPLGPLHRLQDLHMSEILVALLANFVHTGNPTANGTLGFRWSPVTSEGPLNYLSLTTTPTMQSVDTKVREFWSSLPTQINKLLYPERFREDEF